MEQQGDNKTIIILNGLRLIRGPFFCSIFDQLTISLWGNDMHYRIYKTFDIHYSYIDTWGDKYEILIKKENLRYICRSHYRPDDLIDDIV